MNIGKKVRSALALLLVFTMLFSTLTLMGCNNTDDSDNTPHTPTPDTISDNYRTFYQIFVGSFSDSNGDGCGDIRGIINRIDYLNDGDTSSGESLGVQGIWLSPIFSSPSYHK